MHQPHLHVHTIHNIRKASTGTLRLGQMNRQEPESVWAAARVSMPKGQKGTCHTRCQGHEPHECDWAACKCIHGDSSVRTERCCIAQSLLWWLACVGPVYSRVSRCSCMTVKSTGQFNCITARSCRPASRTQSVSLAPAAKSKHALNDNTCSVVAADGCAVALKAGTSHRA